MRFLEEVELLATEMDRVLRYFMHREQWWILKTLYAPSAVTSFHQEGLIAYASCQAALCIALRENFFQLWHHVPDTLKKLYKELEVYKTSSSAGAGES